jgi:hypothetical protein
VLQDGQGRDKQLFKKVAVVENFFDIIYSVHVEMEGRAGKHAGQKRTYRTVSWSLNSDQRSAISFSNQCVHISVAPGP